MEEETNPKEDGEWELIKLIIVSCGYVGLGMSIWAFVYTLLRMIGVWV